MYLNQSYAKVYDHPTESAIVVLEWQKVYVQLEQGQKSVNAVLEAVQQKGKTKLLALIHAEGYESSFLDWLVSDWYTPAYQSGLTKIAHQMGDEIYATTSAEIVSWEDKSGIVFQNFYQTTDKEIISWLLS
jgi:hypothetical protein